jgi:hypothetical protein
MCVLWQQSFIKMALSFSENKDKELKSALFTIPTSTRINPLYFTAENHDKIYSFLYLFFAALFTHMNFFSIQTASE